MTEEAIKKVVRYKNEIDSLEKFLEVPHLYLGFDLLEDGKEHRACGVLATRILTVIEEYKKELEKELEEM